MGASERDEVGARTRPRPSLNATSRADPRVIVAGIVCAVVGTILAIIAVVILDGGGANAVTDANLLNVLAYAATWVPMLAAVVVFVLIGRARSLRRARPHLPTSAADAGVATGVRGILGLRFHPIDLLWGAAIGVMIRCVASFVNLLIYGTTGLSGQVLLAPVDGWYVFTAAIAPVILAPVIEELFFRGLMQGSLIAAAGSRMDRVAAMVIGVAVTSIAFTCVHLIGVTTAGQAASIAIPLLLLAGASGTTTALTGQIGGAIIAHVVFNGSAVLLTWPH